MPKHYIFIGGVHRSCTSILFKTLKTSAQVSGHHKTGVVEDEGQFLQTVYPPAYKFGGVGRFATRRDYNYTETHKLATKVNSVRLHRQWAKHWDMNKRFLCEKTPANIVHTRFLQVLFPIASTFLIITRHPIATILASNIFRKTKLPLDALFANWVTAHETFKRDRAHLKSWLQIKAEDFIQDPLATIKKIEEKLGEDLKINVDTINIRKNINNKYKSMWIKIPKPERERLIVKWNRRVIPFGYNLRGFCGSPPHG